MRRIAVFCGSSEGRDPVYVEAARALGRALAAAERGLVYGGASVGLMGAVADAALEAGGEVVGVIPQALVDRELAHPRLTELHVVGSMHERKALMVELADGFVALPGGLGTVDELAEAITWSQLGIHGKPCALLNVAGYWDAFLAFADHARDEGFVRPHHRSAILVEERPEALLDRLAEYRAPEPKWTERTAPPA